MCTWAAPQPLPDVSKGGKDTLYMTYMSGSTGRPKGAVVLHQGFVRLVDRPDFG
jgi:acyl-coenzyme A synthetase/AMP-(fatty) acid ligase